MAARMFEGFRKRRLHRELLRAFEEVVAPPDSVRPAVGNSQSGEVPRGEGPEVYRLDAPEPWSVRDDGLADRLGLRSNHAAEKKAKRELEKVDPDLCARVEFDSEADTFFAYVASEQDALAVTTTDVVDGVVT